MRSTTRRHWLRFLPAVSASFALPIAVAFAFVVSGSCLPARAQNPDAGEEPYAAPADDARPAATAASSAPASRLSFAQLMSGKSFPLKLRLRDLTRDYRRIAVSSGGSDIYNAQMQMMASRVGVELGLYYTKGQTVTVGGETYLVAYRPQVRLPAEMWNFHGRDALSESTKPGPDTALALSLLNLRTSGSLSDVRPFDPNTDIENTERSNAASVRQLERLGRGVLTYVRGRGQGSLPAMGAAITPAIRRAVYPFVQDPRLWSHPTTEEPYLPNPNLSGKKVAGVRNPAQTVFFFEARPAGDGTRAVLFLDGHVVRVTPAQWQRLSAMAVVFNPPAPGAAAIKRPVITRITLSRTSALRAAPPRGPARSRTR
jgi:hypothetical protein